MYIESIREVIDRTIRIIFFNNIFSFLTGYRKHHGCQDVLVHFVTICQKALDNGDVAIALLTDLSKAFDSLPYKLLLCKLKAYGTLKHVIS